MRAQVKNLGSATMLGDNSTLQLTSFTQSENYRPNTFNQTICRSLVNHFEDHSERVSPGRTVRILH